MMQGKADGRPHEGEGALTAEAGALLARIARQRPRVHCLTNTVAQAFTANVLLATGADVSMAMHPAELEVMLAGASAALVNLGTLNLAREVGIDGLLTLKTPLAMPVVVDPVFADLSPLRFKLALRLLALPNVILKGNAREMAALSPLCPPHVTQVVTGAVDTISGPGGMHRSADGDALMARVSGTGCAAGAVIAAFAAVEPDALKASSAAMAYYNRAGRIAARRAEGPGSFAVHFLDALAQLSAQANGAAP
jgi:hydroxyethylthiazole kinase